MNRKLGCSLVIAAAALAAQAANAATLSLVELALKSSVDSKVADRDYVPPGGWPAAGADLSGFNNLTGLGSIKYTFSGAGNYYVAGFFDYQFEDTANGNGINDEYAVNFGSPLAGQSYKVDDPFASSIFLNFSSVDSAHPLPNTIAYASSTSVGNVSMALAYSLALGASDPDTDVIFTAALAAPSSGFYIQQVGSSGDNVFLSMQVVPHTTPGPSVPEPGAYGLLALALGAAVLASRQKR